MLPLSPLAGKGGGGIGVNQAEPRTYFRPDVLVAVAAQIVPGAKFWDSDASHRVHFHTLKDKDRLVAFELVRYLCDQGWEPFEAHLESRPYVGGTVYLRKAF